MRWLLVRQIVGMQFAVAACLALMVALVWQDSTGRRSDLLESYVRGTALYVEQALAHGESDAELLARLAAMPAPVALLDEAPAGMGELPRGEGGLLQRAPWGGGPVGYTRLSDGRVLKIGPGPRLVEPSLWLVLSLFFGSLGVVGAVGWLLARPTVRGLERVDGAAQRVGAGDLTARAAVDGRGPVADLGRRFDEMAERVARVMDGQRHMVHAVSHELRTPIARVRFTLELLDAAGTPEARDEIAASIGEDLDQVDALLDELLTFLRLNAGAPELRAAPVELREVVDEVVERLAPLAGEIALSAHGQGSALVGRRWVERAVENLVTNALRHAAAEVRVAVAVTPRGVEVVVDDDGAGVPADRRDSVFEPFATWGEPRGGLGGRGLGLAIVARIAAWHGGGVEVGDSPSGGARFVAWWPTA